MEVVALILLSLHNSARSFKVKNYWVIELMMVLLLLLHSHVKQETCSTSMNEVALTMGVTMS